MWCATRDIIEKFTLDAIDVEYCRPRAIAGGESPAILAVPGKSHWIVDRILLLHQRCASAVLEIIHAFGAHWRILYAAKIHPDVRQLVREQGAGVEIVVAITLLPLIVGSPVRVTTLR